MWDIDICLQRVNRMTSLMYKVCIHLILEKPVYDLYLIQKSKKLTVTKFLSYHYGKGSELLERGGYKDVFLARCNLPQLCCISSFANSNSIYYNSFVLYSL